MNKEKIIQVRNDFDKAFGLLEKPYNHELQVKLLSEELYDENELFDSLKKLNRQGIVDGCTDVFVICLGALNSLKVLNDTVLDINPNNKHIDTEVIETFFISFKSKQGFSQHTCLSIIIKDILAIAKFFDINLEQAYYEVMRSNMSKLDSDGKPIINGETIYNGRNDVFNGLKLEIGDVIYDEKRPKGKVLKSVNFFEPDLSNY